MHCFDAEERGSDVHHLEFLDVDGDNIKMDLKGVGCTRRMISGFYRSENEI